MFLVSLDCLIHQTARRLERFGITDYGIVAGNYPESPDSPLQIVSLQTLERRSHWLDLSWDLFVFDEAHMTCWRKISQQIFERFRDAWILGLTATPFRLAKTQSFGDLFTDAILAPNMLELTAMGFLSPMRYKGLNPPDTSTLKTLAGDFEEEGLSKLCNTKEAIKSAIDGYEYHAAGKKTIAFCVDVAHTIAVYQEFCDRGYSAAFVTGTTPMKERIKLFEKFKTGETMILSACNALSTGFDEESVEVGLLMRPTQSPAIHVQQIGRVARIFLGKTHGLILDAAGNLERLGFPEDISGRLTKENILSKGAEKEASAAPTKICPGELFAEDGSSKRCDAILPIQTKECPQCGRRFEVESGESDRESAVGTFEDLVNPAYVRSGGEEEHREYYRHLVRRAVAKGRCPSEAFADYLAQEFTKYKTPGHRWARGAIYGEEPSEADIKEFYNKCKRWQGLRKKEDKWCHWLMAQEFGSTWREVAGMPPAKGKSKKKVA